MVLLFEDLPFPFLHCCCMICCCLLFPLFIVVWRMEPPDVVVWVPNLFCLIAPRCTRGHRKSAWRWWALCRSQHDVLYCPPGRISGVVFILMAGSSASSAFEGFNGCFAGLDGILSCTWLRVPPVALHVSQLNFGVAPPPPLCREVSHRNLGLKRCRATRGCRSYSCGCRATLCN